jgi:hypothetical protein
MNKFRMTTVVTLALVAIGSACSDKSYPTSASADQVGAPDLSKKAKVKKGGLVLPIEGALSDGGSFKGTATVTSFEIDPETRVLYAVGTVDGVAKPADDHAYHIKDQAFRTVADLGRVGDVAAADATNMYRPVQAVCDVLFLDLGPLHLDLLGLTVDLARVVLDVNAVAGGGNLLGNLLCGLLGLLDGLAILAQIQALLDTINDILAGLGGLGGLVNYSAPASAATVLGVAAT